MQAVIVAVGTELLGTDRLDTNSLRLTEAVRRFGVAVRRKAVVGDSEAVLEEELRRALAEADLVLVTGGLGPTADDVTREAAAAALGVDLVEDSDLVDGIAARFARHGRRMPESNRKQAQVLVGGAPIDNPRGSAPGQIHERDGHALFLFPGVPHELDGMVESALLPWLAERCREFEGVAIETATLRVTGLPESEVEERVRPAYVEFGRENITILAAAGDVRLRATARGRQAERQAQLAAMLERLDRLVGDAVYSHSEEDSLEVVVGRLLRSAGATVALAESCTGGWIAQRLTAVPGSSAYFLGGAVAYDDRVKVELLGVDREEIARHGAVSEAVARALAGGARRRFDADYGLGVTGVAGPGGGSDEKPVGTVHFALAGPDGAIEHRKTRLPGDRERVRYGASQVGLDMLRRRLQRDKSS
jgi:nicotinamide-nucleotide amidase